MQFYESLRNRWERRRGARLRAPEMCLVGAAASGAAQCLTYPFALVRTRMQAQASDAVATSMASCIVQIARSGGVAGFYRVCCCLLLVVAYQILTRTSDSAT